MIECAADENEALARQLHDDIRSGEMTVADLTKVLTLLAAAPADSLDVDRLARAMATTGPFRGWHIDPDVHRRDAERLAAEYDRLRAEGSSKPHMRQSVNGCVTCERKWSEHTEAEKP